MEHFIFKRVNARARAAFIWWTLLGMICWAGFPGAVWASPGAEKIRVVASIAPLGDFCRHLGGDLVEVQVLVPPGASPHVFEPPPSAVAQIAGARVFVYVGAGLEPWAKKFLLAGSRAHLTVVEAAQGLPLIREVGEHPQRQPEGAARSGKAKEPEEKEHAGHTHEGGNPHVWLDPVLAQDICRRIAAALIQVDPDHRNRYEANLKSYLEALEQLHRDIQQQVSTFRLREFVSFHDAFPYFARRYGLREVGVIEVAPGREPTPRHLQEIVAAIRRHAIRVVFAEPQLNPRIAQVIAREAGVKVLMLDPEGGRPPYGTDYLQMMRHNLAVLSEAMK